MGTERIDIVIQERGARVVKRSLEDIGKTAQVSDVALGVMKRTLLTLGGTALIAKTIQLADTYNNLQNRLKLVTNGSKELKNVTNELFAISNRTRVGFESTAEVYSRTAFAVRELGLSQRETLDFTESLNQAVVLSGATAAEANNALVQLSQGLASSALRGDELRSVLEQLPVVAQTIADGLGVTRGELRKMGEEGKITPKIIIDSFKKARESLADDFGQTLPTVGQALTVLNNELLRVVGTLSNTTGASNILVRGIFALTEALNLLVRTMGFLVTVTAVYFALMKSNVLANFVKTILGMNSGFVMTNALLVIQTGILGTLKAAWTSLNAAIAANPIGALLLIITAVASAFIFFGDEIETAEGKLSTLHDVVFQLFDDMGTLVSDLLDFMVEPFEALANALGGTFKDIELNFQNLLLFTGRFVDKFIGVLISPILVITDNYRLLGPALNDILEQALLGSVKVIEGVVNLVIKGINEAIEGVKRGFNEAIILANNVPGVNLKRLDTNTKAIKEVDFTKDFKASSEGKAAELGKGIAKSFTDALKFNTTFEDGVVGLLDRAEVRANKKLEAIKKERERIAKEASAAELATEMKTLQQEGALLALNSREREIQNDVLRIQKALKRDLFQDERAGVEALLRTNQVLGDQAKLYDDITRNQTDYSVGLQAVITLLEKQKITTEQATLAQQNLRIAFLESQRDFASGVERGLRKLSRDYTDFATQAEGVVTNAFRSMEDAIINFAKTGEFSFKDFANSILEDIARIAIRAAILGPILNFLLPGSGAILAGASVAAGAGPVPGGAATGGLLKGPGTGTSDSILARVSNGEFVVNAAATRSNLGLLQSINSSGLQRGFARGGMVGAGSQSMAGEGSAPMVTVNVFSIEGVQADVETKQTGRDVEVEVFMRRVDETLAANFSQNKGALTRVIKTNSRQGF